MEIKAAINESLLSSITDQMALVSEKLDLVQIDMCDGVFVSNKTFGYAAGEKEMGLIQEALVRYRLDVEYDLMTDFKAEPLFLDRWLGVIQSTKPRRVIFHMDSLNQKQWEASFDAIDERSTDIFLGLNLKQDVIEVEKLLSQYNFQGVQVMGIENLGLSGQPFSEKTLVVLRYLREKFPDMCLMVDGGVSLENAQALRDAGADSVASTSALFQSENLESAIADFLAIDALVSDQQKA